MKMIRTIAAACLLSLPCFSYSLKEMSVEEKVGQILMVHFNGETVNDDAKALIQKSFVGSVIYYNWANGLHSPEQVLALSSDLQTLAKQTRTSIPLLIAADQEGGVVARLSKGFTIFPGNKALGMTGNPDLAEECAFAIGEELRAVGVNLNLSPVVDVNSNPRNPIIGIRSFGDAAETVIPLARSALKGYHRAQIRTSLKHFPGHGDVAVDPHEALPVVKKSKEELGKVELRPFAELAAEADTVMTAHILLPSLDPKNCATLSKPILDLLRKEIGFEGVIISDSLVMEGVLKNCHSSVDEAAICAFNAGCDILCLGGKQLTGDSKLELTVADVQRIHQNLVKAVKDGTICKEKLNRSVQRILDLKNRYPEAERNVQNVNTAEHQALARKVAELAVKTIKNKPVSMEQSQVVIFAPSIVKDTVQQTTLVKMGKTFYFNALNPTEDESQTAQEMAKKSDVVVFCSYNAWKNSAQEALVQSLLKLEKPVIVIALRDPLDLTLFPAANLLFSTFSPTAPSIQAACDQLK